MSNLHIFFGQGEIQVEQCELSSLHSVRQFAAKMLETESRVDILINCAGVKDTPHWRTEDGVEYQLGVNYLAPFLLTHLLLPLIKRSESGARIVNVSCSQHRKVNVKCYFVIVFFKSNFILKFEPENLFKDPIRYKKKYAYSR